MSKLFEATRIGGISLSNRFVRSATWEGMATPEGAVTPRLMDWVAALARGGVGLVISSHSYVSREGQATPWQVGVYEDSLIPGLGDMASAVHDNGGKIVMQLAHAGSFALEKATGAPAWVVSEFEGRAKTPGYEMTAADIRSLAEKFGQAAARARKAGYDGVQVHSGHGYLLSQFLSPHYNRRTDQYGGPVENRRRIHLEVLESIRKAAGRDFPVLFKLNCQDFTESGLTLEDSLSTARSLEQAGLDALELSGGLLTGVKLSPSRPKINAPEKEAYFQDEARAFRKELSLPLILVGGMRSFEVAEKVVEEGVADYISMSRPFIREPDLINRWKSEDRSPARCISDNLCFQPGRDGQGIRCVTAERE